MTPQNITSKPAKMGKIYTGWNILKRLPHHCQFYRRLTIIQSFVFFSKLLKHVHNRLNWNHEKLKTNNYLKVFMQPYKLKHPSIVQHLSSSATVDWMFSEQQDFNLRSVMVDRR